MLFDQLDFELNKIGARPIDELRKHLQRNRQMTVQALKLRHHELVLRIDGLLEQAVDEVIAEERARKEMIDEYQRRG